MSMSYELMMRKKEQIMYATIKGTLTESPYGVFSGFSASNFLELQQQLDTTKPFELVAKINVKSIGSAQTIIGTSTSTYIQLGVRGTGVAMMLLGTGGSSFNIGILYTSTVLSTNTDYWIKGKFTGTKYELYLSTDGINWNLENSIESSTLISNSPITLQMGNGHISNWYLHGSIDLNNSYIKLGSTKYNLQAVVGYTVVGSPTIVDGVVSGFGLNNYISVPTDFNGNDFEINLKMEDVGADNLARTIMRLKNADITIGLTSSNRLSLTGINDFYFNNGFNTSGLLFVKFVQKGLNYSFGYSNDGIIYTMLNKTLTEQISYTSPNHLIQSSNWNNIPIKLYIKDSYIKINNKLWFNGQQA